MCYTLNIRYNTKQGRVPYEFMSLNSFAECWERCYEVAKQFNGDLITIEMVNYSVTKDED